MTQSGFISLILTKIFFPKLTSLIDKTSSNSPSWLEKIQKTVRNILQVVNIFQDPVDKSGTIQSLVLLFSNLNIGNEFEEIRSSVAFWLP